MTTLSSSVNAIISNARKQWRKNNVAVTKLGAHADDELSGDLAAVYHSLLAQSFVKIEKSIVK